MNDIKSRLHRLHAYIDSKRGVSLRLLYSVDGAEKTGTVDNMIADHGTFVRVLGGSSLDDFDRMFRFELENIHIME